MSDLNNVTVVGRLVRDPELKQTPSGLTVGAITVACNRVWKDANGQAREESAFIPVVVFGRPAEWLRDHKRGEPILISGRLRTESWEKDDRTLSKLVLVADVIRFFQRNQAALVPASRAEAAHQDSIPF